ncbi:MAG: DUF937 domain-containing protein [Alphaproteobacteria bacterium]|nr:DUF937 domain-containing protein [Alphaproteobacteria bacterium]MBV9862235.1 DUF937 domain-containing protein [Alphaproteobacteria bacterium]
MGLLDEIVGQVLGQPQQQSQQPQPGGMGTGAPGLGNVLMQLLGGGQGLGQGGMGQSGGFNQGGGLAGLIQQFRGAGLGNIADSWVGNGPNQPVSPQQLRSVFGEQQVQSMARQSGMQSEDFLSQLSQHLPRVVDGMTPQGRLPDEGTVSV